jgi:putative solute:sodium symporter small subunit
MGAICAANLAKKEERQMADQSINTKAKEDSGGYWSANIRIITISLIIWALVSFGFGILLRPMLSGISVGGTDLGFWFAQQGSILVFLALIFFYAWRMNKLDREYGVEED